MDWATVAVRFALYLDLAALFGLPLFALYALRQEERRSPIGASFATLCKVAATLGIVLSFVNIAVMAKGMTGAFPHGYPSPSVPGLDGLPSKSMSPRGPIHGGIALMNISRYFASTHAWRTR